MAAPPSPLVRVLYNRGGLLTEPRDYAVRACPASSPRPGVVVALLDDDSLPDLAVNGSAALLLNRGGSFEYRYIGGVTPCFGGSAVAAADLNEDGTQDLAWLTSAGINVLLNMGGARFAAGRETQAQVAFPLGSGNTLAGGYWRILRTDTSGDGSTDLVVGASLLSSAARAPVRCPEAASP